MFLDRRYPHAIQRADAIRYFILHEYGGIYLDLDIVCLSSLDFLRAYNFTAPKTYPIGLSNDVLSSQPKDAFAAQLIHNLARWQKWFFVKYLTVMLSAGPLYLTVQYSGMSSTARDGVAILPPQLYGKYVKGPDALLQHLHGSSWHGDDAAFVLWLERHWILAVALGSCLAAAAVALTWRDVHYHRHGHSNHHPYRRCGGSAACTAASCTACTADGGTAARGAGAHAIGGWVAVPPLLVKQPSAEL